MRTRFLVSVVVLLTLTSSVGAQQAAQPPTIMELPPTPAVEDAKLTPVPQPPHVLRSWQEAVALSRGRSTDLRIARSEIERARGLSRQALAGALPTLNGSASVTRTLWDTEDTTVVTPGSGAATTQDPWTWRASLTLTQPLIAPRAWYAIGTASRGERLATLSAEDQERVLMSGVAEALIAVVVAERVAELNRAGLKTSLESLELTKLRERLGAANALDVVRTRQDAAVARSAVVTGDESLRQAREALGIALGFGEPWGVAHNFDLRALELGLRGRCGPVANVAERPDLAAARGAIEVAERDVTDVRLQFVPHVDLTSTLATQPARVGSGAAADWSVSAVLSVPIWEGGVRYGSLRVAKAGVDEAQQRLESARRSANVDVARALRGVDVAQEARTVSTEARDLAVETDRLARLGFAAGRGTSLDLVQAAQQRRQAEIQLALKEFDVVGARIGALLAMSKCSTSPAVGADASR